MAKKKTNKIIGKWIIERYIVEIYNQNNRESLGLPIVGNDDGVIYWGGSKRDYVPSFTEISNAQAFAKRAIRRLAQSVPNYSLGYRTIKIGVVELV